jgi:hypothetical protein
LAPSAFAASPLSASKTAVAHWEKSYSWSILKSVDKASWTLENGKSGVSNYTVAVTKTLASERIWVDGSVCVTNSGDTATENLKIADRIRVQTTAGNFVTLEKGLLDTSANPVLDPGESHCYGYSFEITPHADAAEYRNIASATVTNDPREPGAELGPSTFAIFTMPGAPSVTNDTVNVDDSNGMTWQFSDSGSVSYAKSFTCGADAGTHANTATIRETGQSASASVSVTCTKPPTNGCDKPGAGGSHNGHDHDNDDKNHKKGKNNRNDRNDKNGRDHDGGSRGGWGWW